MELRIRQLEDGTFITERAIIKKGFFRNSTKWVGIYEEFANPGKVNANIFRTEDEAIEALKNFSESLDRKEKVKKKSQAYGARYFQSEQFANMQRHKEATSKKK